ncbi:hypothetical protein [Afipia carboxidovorans]|uniref:hypothetical protein n=1 Tax=Afipia carboxidovorans TaxID=40137 RepID=UPI0030862A78|nr:hypothetical protein CRBSH125_09900 [Afipia carboxidovorans]
MTYKEMFFVQVFEIGAKNRLIPGRVYEVSSKIEAERKAGRLADRVPGVIAFSQLIDTEIEDAHEPVVLAHYGQVPDEARAA